MRISVIVPVYNAERYLDKCIASILAQSFSDFELVLINDGSTDNSGEICNNFAKKDSRIKVIHKENGGASSARNAGMEIAAGDYIAFVDCDDYVETDFLEQLYKIIANTDSDLAVSGCVWEQHGGLEYRRNPAATYTKREYIDAVCTEKIAYITAYGPCCKLYKTSFLQENGITFDTAYKLSEDRLFNLDVMACMHRAVSTDYVGYHYVDNPASLTHNRKNRAIVKNIIEAEIEVWNRFEHTVKQAGLYTAYEAYIKKWRVQALMTMEGYIANSQKDGSGLTKRSLYKAVIPVAKNALLTPEQSGVVWRVLKHAIAQNKVTLLQGWMWAARLKRKMKRHNG